MKKIQDYLHFYLGCDIQSRGGKHGKLVSVSGSMCIVVYDGDDPVNCSTVQNNLFGCLRKDLICLD